ncbi:MurR/RpiR family transcriptional regulator [Mycoplasma putrefaciens]|uniref:MurR/RpiR family transcriptional regulator n=1 Tax=Mycoplasma putrefaciens TaxID=2123 RepID=UPI003DA248C9
MNVIEKIKQNKTRLSPQEMKVCDFILDNISDYKDFSVKSLAKRLDVNPSVITKTLIKLEIGGFKQLIYSLESNTTYFKNLVSKPNNYLIDDFQKRLILSFKHLQNNLDLNKIKQAVNKLLKSKRIIIFATGKTKILANFLFFSLIELNLNVQLYSDLYDSNAYQADNATVIVLSLSGNNSKINRYLNLIHNQKINTLIAISSTQTFKTNINFDFHFYGNNNDFFINDNKTNPMIEKYKVQYILDLFILTIINQIDADNIKFQEKVRTANSV